MPSMHYSLYYLLKYKVFEGRVFACFIYIQHHMEHAYI